MRSTWIGSATRLALGAVCVVALSMAPFGCAQSKGSATQTKGQCACKKVEGKPCACKQCAEAKPCACNKCEGNCPENCAKAAQTAGKCGCPEGTQCNCKKATAAKSCGCKKKAGGK